MAGMLLKKGGGTGSNKILGRRNWKQRFFVLSLVHSATQSQPSTMGHATGVALLLHYFTPTVMAVSMANASAIDASVAADAFSTGEGAHIEPPIATAVPCDFPSSDDVDAQDMTRARAQQLLADVAAATKANASPLGLLGTITLAQGRGHAHHADVRSIDRTQSKHPHHFQIALSTDLGGRCWDLRAASDDERETWITAIHGAIEYAMDF